MDSDLWSDHLASATKRYQLAIPSLSEEVDGEEEFREEFVCPLCSEYFDIVSLCCHIDEDHQYGSQKWVNEMLHGAQGKIKKRRVTFHVKEFHDGNFQSLFGASSCIVSSTSSSSSVAADPLLSSFISPIAMESCMSQETGPVKKTSNHSLPERNVKKPSLSAEDHKQKVKRSEFVRELLSSTILVDGL